MMDTFSPSQGNMMEDSSFKWSGFQGRAPLCAGFDAATIVRAGRWKSLNILARNLEGDEHNVWNL